MLETSLGDITIAFTPDKAPEHVRNFLRLASAGVYDGTSWHRVVKGFVVQTGHMPTRTEPLNEAQQRFVRDLKAEFNDQIHELGTVSMARLAEPDTANTSFFIVTARAPMLDQKYTVFGRVRQRHRRRAEDRSRGGERRNAGRADRAAARADRRRR